MATPYLSKEGVMTASGFAGLPQDCLTSILSHCSPKATGRLACLDRSWRMAAESDVAWGRICSWTVGLRDHFPALQSAASLCEAFRQCVAGVHSKDGSMLVKVNPSSGKMQLHVSASKNFRFILNPDPAHFAFWMGAQPSDAYWEIKQSVTGSDFRECAYLNSAWWFQLHGRIRPDFPMPWGQYSLRWKMSKSPTHFSWSGPVGVRLYSPLPPAEPPRAGLQGSEHGTVDEQQVLYLTWIDFNRKGRLLHGPSGAVSADISRRLRDLGFAHCSNEDSWERDLLWETYYAGEMVLGSNEQENECAAQLDVGVELVSQYENIDAKSGLYVDSLIFTQL